MLRKQLIAAIGKEVTPADFAQYMRFHGRKLTNAEEDELQDLLLAHFTALRDKVTA